MARDRRFSFKDAIAESKLAYTKENGDVLDFAAKEANPLSNLRESSEENNSDDSSRDSEHEDIEINEEDKAMMAKLRAINKKGGGDKKSAAIEMLKIMKVGDGKKRSTKSESRKSHRRHSR